MKKLFRVILALAAAALICGHNVSTVYAAYMGSGTIAGDYIIPYGDSQYINAADVDYMSDDMLRLAINEFYARHGRTFRDRTLQDYFNSKSWYRGTVAPDNFRENVFNQYEKANIATLQKVRDDKKAGRTSASTYQSSSSYQQSSSSYQQPSSSYQSSSSYEQSIDPYHNPFASTMYTPNPADPASTNPYLSGSYSSGQYSSGQYSSGQYSSGQYSASSSEFLIPNGDSRYIDASELYGMDDTTLRLALNEFYARRGRQFRDRTIQNYFNTKSWYRGTVAPDSFRENVFNQYERHNIDVVVKEQSRRK